MTNLRGGGAMGRLQSPSENVFRFFPAKANEKQVHTTSNASQNRFFAYDRTLLLKLVLSVKENRTYRQVNVRAHGKDVELNKIIYMSLT